ncbi:MAG: hypothetical protein AB7F59_12860, partial [Bdellovibrionales bacterium]
MAKRKKENMRSARGTEWMFPRRTLEDAVVVAQVIEDKFAGKPADTEDLSKALGFSSKSDWRLRELIIASEQYGLTDGRLNDKQIRLTNIGAGVVAPKDPKQRQDSLLNAFESVQTFKDVAEHYRGKKIPESEYFTNTLNKEFKITKDRVSKFSEIFLGNIDYLQSFGVTTLGGGPNAETKESQDLPTSATSVVGGREHINTCFVLMPFGEYHDMYFNELYSPAIKDAGLDAERADGIFTTGTVMEQIWDRIKKASVLVAELTGKNPNVFYELGLAHSHGNPVILIAGSLDDVPFDL